jgi:hypothetical protein
MPAACIAQGGDVIDVDAEAEGERLRHEGLTDVQNDI